MLETLTHSLSEIDFTLNRANVIRWLRPFAAATPTFYLLFVIPVALLGYLALLLFPVLSLWLYFELIISITSSGQNHWPDALLLGSFLLLTILPTISLMRLKFSAPAGVPVTQKKTPVLAALIKDLQAQYGKPRLSRILITRDDTIKISRTPVSWFPIKFRNSLEIGLSALLCTSKEEFRGMLAREIAKLASHKNPVTGWMLKLHIQWAAYRDSLERQDDPVLKPLNFFFRYYSPVYNAISFFAARRAEILADRYTLEVMEDDDAIISMIQAVIFQRFLREKYWPLVYNQPRDGKHRLFLPYKKMSQTIKKSITSDDRQRWIELELRKFGDTTTTLPPLRTRLHLLGHEKPVYPAAPGKTAAESTLNESMLQLLINSFDKSWMRTAGFQ